MWASMEGRTVTVHALIEAGADPNQHNKVGVQICTSHRQPICAFVITVEFLCRYNSQQ
jgi:ankyrin repeat protein